MPLRAWYPLNGSAVNMGAGAFDLTQTTAPTWAIGKTAAQALNAGAFKWTAAQTASIMNNEEFSYACWFYVDAASGTSASDYKKIFGAEGGTNSSNRKFTCGQYPTVNGFHVSSWNGSSLISCCRIDDALPSYQWTHICYSYKKGTINIYINGALRKSTELTMNNSSYSAETPVIWNYTGRRLQDVRIYDHALSQKEVTELAKGMMLHIPMYAGYPGIGTNIAKSTSSTPVAYSIGQYYTRMQYDTNFYGLKAGDTYTFSFKVTAPSDRGIRTRVQYYTNNDTRTSVTGSLVAAGTTGYSYLTSTISSAQRGYTQMELLIQNGDTSLTSSATCYISEVKLERGTVRTPWSPDVTSSQFTSDYSIKDCSGYQASVSTSGSAVVATGDGPRYNSSVVLGETSYVQYPVPAGISQCTIAFWVKRTGGGAYSTVDCLKNNPSGGMWLGVNIESSKLWAYWGGTYNKVSGSLTANTWYHVAMTFNAGVTQWYLDGVAVGSAVDFSAKGTTWPSGTRAIGNSYTGSTWNTKFSGSFSDWRFYTTVLTAAQIKELYNAPISVADTGACLSEQFTEGATGISFAKTGVVSCNGISSLPGKYDPEVLIEPDGSCWAHIGHHADPATYKFASGDPFATGVWKDDRRFLDPSICNNVDKWEFLVVQKKTSGGSVERYRWSQPVNPNTTNYSGTVASTITRYGTADGYNSSSYGGMYYNAGRNSYYVCNDGTSGDWYGAIGCWTDFQTGIPAYNGGTIKDGGYTDLYIRIDNVTFSTGRTGCSLDKGGKGVLSPEFIEQ